MKISAEVLERYDTACPRYTSYPTVPVWTTEFGTADYTCALQRASRSPETPLALYVHIPFCSQRCWYCGCNVVISKKQEIVDVFLDHIEIELALVARELGTIRTVSQLHWGGGTPTYLTPTQMERLFNAIIRHFAIAPCAEIAIEVDPRVTSPDHLTTLRSLGFNRISMGVQDFTDVVQKAIGRNQRFDQTESLVKQCRSLEFTSLNFDLIYGLPHQTAERWHETLESTLRLAPDRIAIYSYAHLPETLKHQAKIEREALPDRHLKYRLLADARDFLERTGYVSIGMDHFARSDDELAVAMKDGRLRRNFMGYTATDAEELVGIGPSAIGNIGGIFNQNEKQLYRYYRALDVGKLATNCGTNLSEEDRMRGWVIQQLMSNFIVGYDRFADRFGVDFITCFTEELKLLEDFVRDSFLTIDAQGIRVLPLGQTFVRNIAMVFDAYVTRADHPVQFSHSI